MNEKWHWFQLERVIELNPLRVGEPRRIFHCRHLQITPAETFSADVLFHRLRPVSARTTYLSFATRSEPSRQVSWDSPDIPTPAQSFRMTSSSSLHWLHHCGSCLSTKCVEYYWAICDASSFFSVTFFSGHISAQRRSIESIVVYTT